MFRDDEQRAKAIRCLLRPARLTRYLSNNVSTFGDTLYQPLNGLSHGEYLLVQVARAFWNSNDAVSFSELLYVLNSDHTRRIATLWMCIAQGADAVDAWIMENQK